MRSAGDVSLRPEPLAKMTSTPALDEFCRQGDSPYDRPVVTRYASIIQCLSYGAVVVAPGGLYSTMFAWIGFMRALN
jgi:hypothetical protein